MYYEAVVYTLILILFSQALFYIATLFTGIIITVVVFVIVAYYRQKQHSGNQESPQGNLTHIHNAHITVSSNIHAYMQFLIGDKY